MGEFQEVYNEISTKSEIRGVVLISGKPDCFIAGADIGYVVMSVLNSISKIQSTLSVQKQNKNSVQEQFSA